MTEYKIGKAVVRVHGKVDIERLTQACKTYLNNKEDKKSVKHNND